MWRLFFSFFSNQGLSLQFPVTTRHSGGGSRLERVANGEGFKLDIKDCPRVALVGRETRRQSGRKTCKTRRIKHFLHWQASTVALARGMGRGQPWEVGGSSKTSSVRWMVARATLLLLLSSPVPTSFLPAATSAPHSFGEGPSAALWALPTFRKIKGAKGYRYLVAWGAG